jgi:hypothetical protein
MTLRWKFVLMSRAMYHSELRQDVQVGSKITKVSTNGPERFRILALAYQSTEHSYPGKKHLAIVSPRPQLPRWHNVFGWTSS